MNFKLYIVTQDNQFSNHCTHTERICSRYSSKEFFKSHFTYEMESVNVNSHHHYVYQEMNRLTITAKLVIVTSTNFKLRSNTYFTWEIIKTKTTAQRNIWKVNTGSKWRDGIGNETTQHLFSTTQQSSNHSAHSKRICTRWSSILHISLPIITYDSKSVCILSHYFKEYNEMDRMKKLLNQLL